MQERNGEHIKNIVEQNEDVNDNEELLSKLQQKLKRWRIFNAIEFCIFLAIILYSCSARLRQNTVIPVPDTDIMVYQELPPDIETEEPEPVPEPEEPEDDINISVARIDIGSEVDFDWEQSEMYRLVQDGCIDFEAYVEARSNDLAIEQQYVIDNVELLHETSEDTLLIDSSFGAAESKMKIKESFSVIVFEDELKNAGSRYWKTFMYDGDFKEFGVDLWCNNQEDGASFMLEIPHDSVDISDPEQLNEIANIIYTTVDDMNIGVTDFFELKNIGHTVARKLSVKYNVGVDVQHFTHGYFEKDSYLLNAEEPTNAVVVNIDYSYIWGFVKRQALPNEHIKNGYPTAIDEAIAYGYHQ